MAVILASQSAARAQILHQAGVRFETTSSGVDEDEVKAGLLGKGRSPAEVAEALAETKALRVSARRPDAVVIGADQTLELHGQLIDKAKSQQEALARLIELRGLTHRLHSAVAVAREGVVIWRELRSVSLTMRDFSDDFATGYVSRNVEAVMACVGGYQLEGEGVQLFDSVDGDYFTILGLPIFGLLAQLRALGAIEA